MGIVVICPMGTSPPIATEFINYLSSRGEFIDAVVLIGTSEPQVIRSVYFTEAAIKTRYTKMRIYKRFFDRMDIVGTSDVKRYLRMVVDILLNRKWVNREIYVNIAGGRKTMVYLTSIAVSILGTPRVFHVVAEEVKSFSEEVERNRWLIDTIGKIGSLRDRVKAYLERREVLDTMMYPPMESYKVIELPVVPLTKAYIMGLREVLEANRYMLDMAPAITWTLEDLGFIRVQRKKDYVYISRTVKGDKLLNILRGEKNQ